MEKISLTIITFNEAENIRDCIISAKEVVDEVIVIDSYSTDRTVGIAESLGAKVILREFDDYGSIKRFSTKSANYDWILSLDADERLSQALKDSILKAKTEQSADGYTMNRLTYYCGKPIKSCGWYPDRKLRFFHRKKGDWNKKPVHESVEMSDGSRVGHLQGDLIHFSFPDVSEHIRKVNKYSDIKSQEVAGYSPMKIAFKLVMNPIWVFFKMYILKIGITDGLRGFTIASISAFTEFMTYSKAWLYKAKKGRNSL